MKTLLSATVVLALALLAAPPLAARADDAIEKAGEKIRWVEGWAAGREAAKKSGKLMFVYVHRVNPG